MADTPDKPSTDTPKPTTARRRAPRKTAAKTTAASAKKAVRKTATRVATKVEQAAETAGDAVVKAERAAVRAVKPRASSRAKPAPTTRRPAASRTTATTSSGRPGKWSIAAIAGGIAAAGATVAALLSLRGSRRSPDPIAPRATDVAEGKETAAGDSGAS